MSSPAASLFPPSSAPGGSPESSSLPQQSRQIIDPLAFDNVRGLAGTQNGDGFRGHADEAEEDNADGAATRRRRVRRGQDDLDAIPRVRDTTGEQVADTFKDFLAK
jgi:DNA replication licensing factor MCM6